MPETHGQIEGYRFCRLLGSGGMGRVFLAIQESTQRPVAVKVLHPHLSKPEIERRFRLEKDVIANLNHPYIAQLIDTGVDNQNAAYLVMEYIDGTPLDTYLQGKVLTTKQRLELFEKICLGVQHAHQKGIIHRDLKPSNILITSNEGSAFPKIIDFGIAKVLSETSLPGLESRYAITTHAGPRKILGSLGYMSPEQALGRSEQVDIRTDIYALGILLFEILLGRPPFDLNPSAVPEIAYLYKLIRNDIQPPSVYWQKHLKQEPIHEAHATTRTRLINTFAKELDWVVIKASAKTVEHRYESTSALIGDVRAFLENRPISARPSTLAYTFRKAVSANPWLTSAAVFTVLALAFGLILSRQSLEVVKKSVQKEQQARQQLSQANQQLSQSLADAFFNQGISALKEEDYNLALANFGEALKNDPNHWAAKTHLFNLLTRGRFLAPRARLTTFPITESLSNQKGTNTFVLVDSEKSTIKTLELTAGGIQEKYISSFPKIQRGLAYPSQPFIFLSNIKHVVFQLDVEKHSIINSIKLSEPIITKPVFSESSNYILIQTLKKALILDGNLNHILFNFRNEQAFTDITFSPDEKQAILLCDNKLHMLNLETNQSKLLKITPQLGQPKINAIYNKKGDSIFIWENYMGYLLDLNGEVYVKKSFHKKISTAFYNLQNFLSIIQDQKEESYLYPHSLDFHSHLYHQDIIDDLKFNSYSDYFSPKTRSSQKSIRQKEKRKKAFPTITMPDFSVSICGSNEKPSFLFSKEEHENLFFIPTESLLINSKNPTPQDYQISILEPLQLTPLVNNKRIKNKPLSTLYLLNTDTFTIQSETTSTVLITNKLTNQSVTIEHNLFPSKVALSDNTDSVYVWSTSGEIFIIELDQKNFQTKTLEVPSRNFSLVPLSKSKFLTVSREGSSLYRYEEIENTWQVVTNPIKSETIFDLAEISPSGSLLVGYSYNDNSIQIRTTQNLDLLANLEKPSSSPCRFIFSRDEKFLAILYKNSNISLVEMERFSEIPLWPVPTGELEPFVNVAFSIDNRFLIIYQELSNPILLAIAPPTEAIPDWVHPMVQSISQLKQNDMGYFTQGSIQEAYFQSFERWKTAEPEYSWAYFAKRIFFPDSDDLILGELFAKTENVTSSKNN